MGVYLRWKERTQYIVTQKAQGVVDIEVKAPIPAKNKHSALYGLYDMSGDATKWPNTSIAEYFGIHSIKGIDSNEPWKPAWKKK
ncbi:hypothetical protein FACS1894199_06150 [Bacteroidia bacterium]|nr:hypothetical protein FACS1894199_06150 [Bacteroidia bacterium]